MKSDVIPNALAILKLKLYIFGKSLLTSLCQREGVKNPAAETAGSSRILNSPLRQRGARGDFFNISSISSRLVSGLPGFLLLLATGCFFTLQTACTTVSKEARPVESAPAGKSVSPLRYKIPGYTFGAISADLNGDRFEDLVIISKYNGLYIYFSDGKSLSPEPLVFPTFSPHGTSISTGDFNGDSIPDIAYVTESEVQLLVNDGTGRSFSDSVRLAAPDYGMYMKAADLNNDGISDFVALGASDPNIYLHLSTGKLTYETQLVIPSDPTAYFGFLAVRADTGDADGNGFTDILIPELRNSALWLLKNDDGLVFTPLLLMKLDPENMIRFASVLHYDKTAGEGIIAVASGTHTPLLHLLAIKDNVVRTITKTPLPYPNPEHITFKDRERKTLIITHSRDIESFKGAVSVINLSDDYRTVKDSTLLYKTAGSGVMTVVRQDLGLLFTVCQNPHGVVETPLAGIGK